MRCFPFIFWLISLLPVSDQGKYHLAGSEGPIKAQVGSDVVLPCSLEPPDDMRDGIVEWIFNFSKSVHLFHNEADDQESQHESYKDRTILNHKMLEHGDVSLTLAKVTKNDAGIYTCIVLRRPDLTKERIVTLVVVDGKEIENPDSISGGNSRLEKLIEARVGSDRVLPCYVELNASRATVEWKFNSSETVHFYRSGDDYPGSQHESYKDRTILNHKMLEHGDVSLTLTKVTKNDAGIYTCIVHRLPGHDKPEERNIILVVVDGEENENPDSISGEPDPGVIGGWVVGVVVGGVGGVVSLILIFITFYVVRCRRGEQIFQRWSNNSRNEEVRNDREMEMEELQNLRGNGNQGDEAEAEPLQNQEEPN